MDKPKVPATLADPTQAPPPDELRLPSFDLASIALPPIKSVAGLIDLSMEVYPDLPFVSSKVWAFRGQPKNYGRLVPSFERQFTQQSFHTAEIIENRLLEAFRTHYADLKDRSEGMPAPDKIGVQHELRCLSVMQHYEIPTRLLDWSSNFWTAVYFACASEPKRPAELWCYDREIFVRQRNQYWDLNPLVDHSDSPAPEPRFLQGYVNAPIVELDPQITPRMKQQKAHHTVSNSVFSDHAPLLFDLQAQYYHPDDRVGLRRILIDGSCKGKALQFLAEERKITASTIFPDVVGLGRFLKWQFESLRTMLF